MIITELILFVTRINMSGHANVILPNGTWLGVNDSSKALGFVVLSLVATLSWEIHTTTELQQGKKKMSSVLHALRAYVYFGKKKAFELELTGLFSQFI